MISNSDMTLYTRSIDAELDEKWTRTVITKVLWINEVGITEAIATNYVSVHIPTYNRSLPDMKPRDILVKGICLKEIGVSGYTMRDLQIDYETVEIKRIKRYDFGSPSMQHIKIEAM